VENSVPIDKLNLNEDEGFIEEFKEFLLSQIPTSPSWAEDIATSVVSLVAGPERLTSTRIGQLRLNLWFLYIGPSGLAYKTAPLRYFLLPLLLRLGKLIGRDILLPSSFSIEGLVEYMTKSERAMGMILKDEFTILLKEASGDKGYNVDILEFLSQLYDGTIQKRYTRKAKLEEVLRPYVVFLGCTTPYIYDVVEPAVFVQGLGNRLLFDYWEGKPKAIAADELFYDMEEDEGRDRILHRFAERLAGLWKVRGRSLRPGPEAASRLAEFKERKDCEAYGLYLKDPLDLKPAYLARAGEMAIKLAGVRAFSRLWLSPHLYDEDIIPITVEDADWAINKVEHHIKAFEKFLSEWRMRPIKARSMIYKAEMEAFLSVIASNPDRIATQREVLEALGWHKSGRFYALREALIENGKIRILMPEEIERLPDDVKKRHGIKIGPGRYPIVFALPP
jgi:hypothetical protein